MKILLFILLFITSLAHGQTTPYTLRLVNQGMGVYVGSTFSDPVYNIGSTTGYITLYKPLRFYNLNTAAQNALSAPLAGMMIYNTDSSTVSVYNGSAWLPLATREYARSVGGGGGGGSGTVTSFSFTDGSGFDGTVTNASSTPALALTTTLTAGSVFLAGSSGALAEDNTNFFYNNTDDRLGLGTNSPASRLNVVTNSLGVTQAITSGLSLVNTTAAAAGAQQISPELRLRGNGWKTNATAASQAVDFRMDVLPVEGAANPTGNLQFSNSINGGAFTVLSSLQSAGHWVPGTTGSYDFGTTGVRWRQLYVNGLNINSSSARADNTINVVSGFTVTNGASPATTGTVNIFTESSAGSTATAGTTTFKHFGPAAFSPTSGTAIFNFMRLQHTINQTGGANGVTTSLMIDPTITAAANYFAIMTKLGKVQLNGLADVSTADSLVAYEDGELEKVATSVVAHGPTSNTYTPTTASPLNIDAVTPLGVKWFRVGKMVHVYGAVDIDPTTTATVTAFTMTLPTGVFGGTFVNNYDASGIANVTYATANESGVVFAIAASALVELRFVATSTASNRWRFSFSYISD